jgi:hypothetical protein
MDSNLLSSLWIFQNDPRWKDEYLGHQMEETIGSWGGLLTALTIIVNWAGYTETPSSVNEALKEHSGFIGALALPAVLPLIYPNLSYLGFENCDQTKAPLEQINTVLESGRPVLAQVDWNPKAEIFSHWVVLIERVDNDYRIMDPFKYRGDKVGGHLLLTHRYHNRGVDPADAITGLLWFDHLDLLAAPVDKIKSDIDEMDIVEQQIESGAEDPVADLSDVILFPTVDGLTFRSAPRITMENQIRKLNRENRLLALEPPAQVIEKVGVQGQWIQVRDENDDEGYVAAWYVYIPAQSDTIDQ